MCNSAEPIQDIAHLGHVELLTPTPGESLSYFVDILGIENVHAEGQSVYLRGYGDYAAVSFKLTESRQAGMAMSHGVWPALRHSNGGPGQSAKPDLALAGQMVMSTRRLLISIYSSLFLLLWMNPVYAYLDAGTASLLLQSLLGGIAVAIASLSVFWQRLRGFFRSKKDDQNDVDSNEAKDQEMD